MGDWSIDGMGQSQFWVASEQGMRLNAAVGNQWDSHAFPNSCDGILRLKASTCWRHESSMMIHHRIFGNLKPFFFHVSRPKVARDRQFLNLLETQIVTKCWNLKWDLLGDVWHSLYPHAWYINRKTYPHLHISYTSATHWPCFSYISSISQLHTNYIAAISAILMFPETSWMPSRVLKTHGDIKISHFRKPSYHLHFNWYSWLKCMCIYIYVYVLFIILIYIYIYYLLERYMCIYTYI